MIIYSHSNNYQKYFYRHNSTVKTYLFVMIYSSVPITYVTITNNRLCEILREGNQKLPTFHMLTYSFIVGHTTGGQ